jgi:dTDP-4-amino-4,6-dideoxygalactose transaminase
MISVFGSFIGEEEIEAVASCMRSQWLGFGKCVEEFEKGFMDKFGLKNFIMVDSGSNALFMAVKILDLEPGSEIILPSFTWVSCAHAVVMAGHRPVFCDVSIDSMNVRASDIEEKITNRTGAIMVVHYAGLSVDMDPILKLGFPVIEDSAHAVNSTYKGSPCGTIGDVGIYSFDAVKNLTAGEGGGLTAREQNRIDRARILRYCGIGKSGFESATAGDEVWWKHPIKEPFIKMLPTNIAGAIGCVQLQRFKYLQARRKQIWDIYQKEFSNILITPQNPKPEDRHSYFTYCVRVLKHRDNLAKHLLNEGIYTTLRYEPLHHSDLYGQSDVKLPNTEQLSREALNIPIHPRMSDADVDKVLLRIKDYL